VPHYDRDYRNLRVWRAAHATVLAVYSVTREFPDEERFGLTAQLRRASVSVAANVVEGCSRASDKAFAAFLDTAHGSASEVEYLLILAHDVNCLEQHMFDDLARRVDEIRRMLAALRRTVRRNGGTTRKARAAAV
jgi:four helix bundle protein